MKQQHCNLVLTAGFWTSPTAVVSVDNRPWDIHLWICPGTWWSASFSGAKFPAAGYKEEQSIEMYWTNWTMTEWRARHWWWLIAWEMEFMKWKHCQMSTANKLDMNTVSAMSLPGDFNANTFRAWKVHALTFWLFLYSDFSDYSWIGSHTNSFNRIIIAFTVKFTLYTTVYQVHTDADALRCESPTRGPMLQASANFQVVQDRPRLSK